MKKLLSIITLILLFSSLTVISPTALSTSARSAVVIDGDGGLIAYEKNARERMGMASTTKIMTALVALENCPLGKEVKIDPKAIGVEGSSIYLTYGESLTMEQLLYALLLQSANDAATAIALEISGSIEGFATLMNEKAAELGLENTHFTNPHGLYDEDHYTTAYDLALITKHALDNQKFREIVSTYKHTIPKGDAENGRILVNHNKLLMRYDGAIGVKTGFTKKTGRCLVSAAERQGTVIIAVTLNAPDDWNDHTKMLDSGFEKIATLTLASPDSLVRNIPVTGGEEFYVTAKNIGGLRYTGLKENMDITCEYIVPTFVFAPVTEGDVLGQAVYYNNGEEIGRIDLIAQYSIEAKKTNKKKLFGLF